MHELGHTFHGLCSKTQYARFHGTAVSRDFVSFASSRMDEARTRIPRVLMNPALHTQVEAPSQMNENFIWTPSIIKRVSSHYERQGETLPDDLIDKLIKSRKLGQGLFNLRQLFFGKVSEPHPSSVFVCISELLRGPLSALEMRKNIRLRQGGCLKVNADSRANTRTSLQYDMALHTDKYNLSPDEMSKLWCDLREQTSLVTIGDQVVGGQSGFAHIAGQSPSSASLQSSFLRSFHLLCGDCSLL